MPQTYLSRFSHLSDEQFLELVKQQAGLSGMADDLRRECELRGMDPGLIGKPPAPKWPTPKRQEPAANEPPEFMSTQPSRKGQTLSEESEAKRPESAPGPLVEDNNIQLLRFLRLIAKVPQLVLTMILLPVIGIILGINALRNNRAFVDQPAMVGMMLIGGVVLVFCLIPIGWVLFRNRRARPHVVHSSTPRPSPGKTRIGPSADSGDFPWSKPKYPLTPGQLVFWVAVFFILIWFQYIV